MIVQGVILKRLRLAVVTASLFSVPALAAPTGLDLAGMDTSVRPQDDLFSAVNGGWISATRIPPDKASYGSFNILRDQSDERVKAIVEGLANSKKLSAIEQKVAVFYRSYMDTDAIDKQGLDLAQALLDRIGAIQNDTDLATVLGEMQGVVKSPLTVSVGPDDKDTSSNVILTWQSGIGLPDRDYFLKDTPKFAKAREAYQTYLETLLRLFGSKKAASDAKEVFALERKIAEAHWDKVDNRDPVKTYNAMDLTALADKAPGVEWPVYFKAAGLTWTNKIIVSQPSMVTGFANLAREFPMETWRAYLRVRVLDSLADVLPRAYRDASLNFHGKTLQGLEEEKPRWQSAVQSLNASLGEAVGQVYVAKHFPPEYKARMQILVDNLMKAYKTSIDNVSWMTPETKTKAHEKLGTYVTKIGYPAKWRDYSALVVKEGDAFGNRVRAGRFEHERKTRKAGQKVDRSEWGMTPQTVNAYYNPNFNEIVFPAAILQPPFFDMAADDAINYGGIGAVIGHEISHGFDDQGSQFDGQGNLNSWWSPADRRAFDALGDRLARQYESYEPLPGHKINGRLTMGENIADLSGLQIAHKAYRLSLGGKEPVVMDGLSGDQRFFYSFGQIWRTKMRDDAMVQRLTTDPHAPPRFRANGAAENDDAFHAAFGTRAGDKMFKPDAERIRIW